MKALLQKGLPLFQAHQGTPSSSPASVEEAAEALQIPPPTVKTRLLRARRRLQIVLAPTLQDALRGAFLFAGEACEALTARVLSRYVP